MSRPELRTAVIGLIAIACACAATASPHKAKDTITLTTPLSSDKSSSEESSLGDVVADSVRETGQSDFALVAADELRQSNIPAGETPISQIVQSLRYAGDAGDQIVVLRLTGAQIELAAERSLSRTPEPFNGFFQISGLRFRCDRARSGRRSVSVTTLDGASLPASGTFTVATTKAIADGSMGYYQIWKRAEITRLTSVSIGDGLRKYLSSRTELALNSEDRILVTL
jgi:hypothetical protein